MKQCSQHSQKGSALFLILIGVALFAALGYAVSNMMQGGSTTNIGDERARLYAGEVLDYARTMRQTVQNLRISNGCRDTDISFENPIESGYVNGTNTACQVFHPDGGGMSYIIPGENLIDDQFSSGTFYQEWFFTGETCLEQVGSNNTNCHSDGIDNSELNVFLPYINKNICLSINERLGIENPGGDTPIDPNSFWGATPSKFQGSFTETGRRIDGGALGSEMAVCIKSEGTNPVSGSYTFLQVLIAR